MSINGLIGGDGKLDEWKVKKEQESGGKIANAYLNDIPLDTLLDTPYVWNSGFVDIVNDDYTEQYNTRYYLVSFLNEGIDSPWFEWLTGLKLDLVSFNYGNRFTLPFENYFVGNESANASGLTLYTMDKWNSFSNGEITPIDYSTQSFGFEFGSVQQNFAWVHTTDSGLDYYGWIEFASNGDTFSGKAILTDISPIKFKLGDKFSVIKKPQTDPQKGVPSIPIGASGDLVKKNLAEIPTPSIPTLGVSTTGALNVYKVEQNDLSNFMSEIFHTNTSDVEQRDDVVSYIADGTNKFLQGMRDWVTGDLTKFVVDCHILPITPTTDASKSNIHIGGYTCDSTAYKVTTDYVTVDFGTITLSPQTVSFYDGASDLNGARYKLYIPYGIGYVDIDPSMAWCHTIGLEMIFNVIDGSCIAFVKSSVLNGGYQSVIGCYSGSCCVHLPMTGENYANLFSGIMSLPQTLASGVVGGFSGAMENGANTIRPNITMSNSYNASTSFMGVRVPHLIIEKPTENLSSNYYERNGGYVNANFKLEDLRGTGYTQCGNVDLMSLGNIKTSEKAEIKRLLEQGVYL